VIAGRSNREGAKRRWKQGLKIIVKEILVKRGHNTSARGTWGRCSGRRKDLGQIIRKKGLENRARDLWEWERAPMRRSKHL